jgi:hypothetical protein
MKRTNLVGTVLLAGAVLAMLASVDRGVLAVNSRDQPCSVRDLAGRWLFATDVGQFPDFGGDITALGTMNFGPGGDLEGRFDFTVAEQVFLPDNTYTGSMVVNGDCTGTLTFVTSNGSVRTDSIAVVSPHEIWGMSQDTQNLWTYRARRISSPFHR